MMKMTPATDITTTTTSADSTMPKAEIGIFGGTGIYDSGLLEGPQQISVKTRFGDPSDLITVGTYEGRRIAFLPRHGKNHTIPPHMINFRANIQAFKEMGISRIVAPSAVGSLRKELRPGDFVLPSQYIDQTKSREYSFSEIGRVIHISMADPFCPEIQSSVMQAAKKQNIHMHTDKTYVCIEGPRFSTKAESKMFRQAGADIIGMTTVPECQLAREARICYASVSTITDYDAWAEKPVTAKEVLETLAKNTKRTKALLRDIIRAIPKSAGCSCAAALDEAEF